MDFQSPVSIFFYAYTQFISFLNFLLAPAATSLVLQKEDVCQGVRGSLVFDDVPRLPSTVQFVRAWLQTKPSSFPWCFEFGWTSASQQSSSCSPSSLASQQLPSISSPSAAVWPPGNIISYCLPLAWLSPCTHHLPPLILKIFWKKAAGSRFLSKEAELQFSTVYLRRIHSFTSCITVALMKEEVFVLLNLMWPKLSHIKPPIIK